MKQPTKARTAVSGETQKRGRCGSTYRYMVGVCSDAVGTKRHHDVRSLLPEHVGDHRLELAGRKVDKTAIGKTEPVMAIGDPPDCPPPRFIFVPPNRAECLPGGIDSRCYLAGITVRRVNQHETQLRITTIERDVSRCTHHIVVGVCHHKRDHSTGAYSHLIDSATQIKIDHSRNQFSTAQVVRAGLSGDPPLCPLTDPLAECR